MKKTQKTQGSGIFHQEKSGSWSWRTTITKRDGSKQRKKITAKTRDELQKKVDKFRVRCELDVTDKLTIKTWSAIFLKTYQKTITGRTYQNYSGALKNYIVPTFKDRELDSIKAFELTEWFSELNEQLSISSVQSIKRIFSVLMSEAVKNGLLDVNPVRLSKTPRSHKKEVFTFSISEVQRILSRAKALAAEDTGNLGTDYLNRMYYVLLRIAITTGCRIGELAALKYAEFEQETSRLYINHSVSLNYAGKEIISDTKTETSTRIIVLDDDSKELLKKWQAYQQSYQLEVCDFYKDNNLIFCNSFGGIMSRTNFSRRYLQPLLKSLCLYKKGVGMHAFRRFHASLLANANVANTLIAARLGHADVSVLEQHYLTTVSDQSKIVSVLNNFDKDIDKNGK